MTSNHAASSSRSTHWKSRTSTFDRARVGNENKNEDGSGNEIRDRDERKMASASGFATPPARHLLEGTSPRPEAHSPRSFLPGGEGNRQLAVPRPPGTA